jgi:hypothetical protein
MTGDRNDNRHHAPKGRRHNNEAMYYSKSRYNNRQRECAGQNILKTEKKLERFQEYNIQYVEKAFL